MNQFSQFNRIKFVDVRYLLLLVPQSILWDLEVLVIQAVVWLVQDNLVFLYNQYRPYIQSSLYCQSSQASQGLLDIPVDLLDLIDTTQQCIVISSVRN